MTKTKKWLSLLKMYWFLASEFFFLIFWFCTTSMNNLGLYTPPPDDVKRCHSTSIPYSTKRPWNKSSNLIFPTKYVIRKRFKGWPFSQQDAYCNLSCKRTETVSRPSTLCLAAWQGEESAGPPQQRGQQRSTFHAGRRHFSVRMGRKAWWILKDAMNTCPLK